jgi:hypothetical protein
MDQTGLLGMSTIESKRIELLNLQDVRNLLGQGGPCISIYMPLNAADNARARQNELHWKECLRSLEHSATSLGSLERDLLQSLRNWDTTVPEAFDNGSKRGSVAAFRSPSVFHVVLLDGEVREHAVWGPEFYIRPLLAEITRDRTFYLLALSQKNTRLLLCTHHSSEEIPFPSDIQTSFDAWMNQAKPDHPAPFSEAPAGNQAAAISGPYAVMPKGADQDAKDQYLSHYFKQIDRGVNDVLKGKTDPLVLCAVEYEIPLYRAVSSYPHLACTEVRGAPNSLKSGEMHARAIQVMETCFQKKIDDVLVEWNHRAGGGASSRLKEVIIAAHEGRVLTLLVSDSLEQPGVFDEATFTATGHKTGGPGDEDLLNHAAVQTILHAGSVLIAPRNKMPHGSPVAAIFRY